MLIEKVKKFTNTRLCLYMSPIYLPITLCFWIASYYIPPTISWIHWVDIYDPKMSPIMNW